MELTGRVVYPDSPTYDDARADWDGLFSSFPRLIVFAERTEDVVNAVSWARRNRLALRVRSGRHSLEGWSNISDGIVVDVSQMKSVDIDVASRTMKVGAGLTQLEAVKALGAHRLAVPTGAEATVGLAGATLGGGFGLLTRKLGMTCDNLIAAEVVVSAGVDGAVVITADEHENADLLWALRGAGNANFGIVTSFTYKVHPLGEVSLLEARWRGYGDHHRVFTTWQQSAPTSNWRLTSILDHTEDGVGLVAVLQAGSPDEARELLAPVLSVGTPEVTVSAGGWEDTFVRLQYPPASAVAQAENWKFFSQFVTKPYPSEAIDLVARYMQDAPSPASNYFCLSFGGAVSKPPSGGSAFVHRNALFYAEPGAGWSGEALTSRALAWVADFSDALQPYVDGAYVNVPNAGVLDWEAAYWGENCVRLREIKATYDPQNVFRYEQSIPLA